jgi:hypothetical protein
MDSPYNAEEFRAFLVEISESQSSFARRMLNLGDDRGATTVLRHVQRIANGTVKLSGEMRVIMTLLREKIVKPENAPIDGASPHEDAIVKRLVKDTLAAGYVISVNDGEEFTVKRSADETEILTALHTTDEDYLHIRKPGEKSRVGWVRLIWGNDADVISDYTDNPRIISLLEGANALAEKLGA